MVRTLKFGEKLLKKKPLPSGSVLKSKKKVYKGPKLSDLRNVIKTKR